jgi:prepilin-type N-terminal cleavage/methylation domain-containing protein
MRRGFATHSVEGRQKGVRYLFRPVRPAANFHVRDGAEKVPDTFLTPKAMRRSGVTLLEVLVAIFVMGIGLLALLTLFPLGALRMAKAIQDERCSEVCGNAEAIGLMKSIANDGSAILQTGLYKPSDPFLNYLSPGLDVGYNAQNNANQNGPSYPVLVDPVGWSASFGLAGQRNLAAGLSFLARRTVTFVDTPPVAGQTSIQAAYQWFTDLNDIDWQNAAPGAGTSPPGTPRLLLPAPNPMVFVRDIRYSYAFLLQRPRYADTAITETQIVVFNKRTVSPTAFLSLPENFYNNVSVNVANNTLTIDYSAPGTVPPSVGVGDWVLDNSPVLAPANVIAPPNVVISAHGTFYRIVAANAVSATQLELELEQPLRGSFPATAAGQLVANVVTLDGVVEVYSKGVKR